VEIDGESHNNPEQQKKDISRQKYLETFNIIFIRIKDEELLGNPNKGFNKLEVAIKLLDKKKQ
jgi:very-short-patch-repair endonuclease